MTQSQRPKNPTSGSPAPLFIFEMANNHMGDVAHGIRIVQELRTACEGFPFRFAIKLQYRHIPDFIHPDFRERRDLKFVKRFTETALSWENYRLIKDAILEHDFMSICTPWDDLSVDKIVEHGYDCIKVPSCYLTDWPLAEKIAKTDLPIIISTAGEPFEEIDRVVSFYQHRNKKLSILHCVGEYPTAEANLQLNQIELLRQRYSGVEIGYSTHESPDQQAAIMLAVAKGATVFEKHVGVPTDRYPLNAYSATPAQVRDWLCSAQRAIAMGGVTGRRHEFSEVEKKTLSDLRRAVFAKRDIASGEIIRSEDVFLSIPGQFGQIVANDLSKYREFRALRPIVAKAPVLATDVSESDHQKAIYDIIQDVKALMRTSRTIVPSQLELEISHHYGLDQFRRFGSTTITVVNREYCKRVILCLPGQTHPEQWHELKDETYHLLYGEIELTLDGAKRTVHQNEVVVIPRGVKHEFTSREGAVIEEISSAYSQSDSYYTDTSINQNKQRKTLITHWMD
jgi:sialic acid synthase SpsE/mannose-6-phosphate isomerase-like protein (cupin superfamily)